MKQVILKTVQGNGEQNGRSSVKVLCYRANTPYCRVEICMMVAESNSEAVEQFHNNHLEELVSHTEHILH